MQRRLVLQPCAMRRASRAAATDLAPQVRRGPGLLLRFSGFAGCAGSAFPVRVPGLSSSVPARMFGYQVQVALRSRARSSIRPARLADPAPQPRWPRRWPLPPAARASGTHAPASRLPMLLRREPALHRRQHRHAARAVRRMQLNRSGRLGAQAAIGPGRQRLGVETASRGRCRRSAKRRCPARCPVRGRCPSVLSSYRTILSRISCARLREHIVQARRARIFGGALETPRDLASSARGRADPVRRPHECFAACAPAAATWWPRALSITRRFSRASAAARSSSEDAIDRGARAA